MKPFLGTHQSLNDKLQIQHVRELTEDEFEHYKKSTQSLVKFENAQKPFEFVRGNSEEFYRTIEETVEAFRSMDRKKINETDFLDITNRVTLNYLTSVRFFLDSTETRIKRRFGKNSQQAKEFEEATRSAFNSSFAYRFLFKLRNYAQHCGSPIESITVKQTPDEPEKATIEVYWDTKALLNEYDGWGSIVKPELQGAERVVINPLVSEMTNQVGELHEVAMRILSVGVKEAGLYVSETIKEALSLEGSVAIYSISDDGYLVTMHHPPLSTLEKMGFVRFV